MPKPLSEASMRYKTRLRQLAGKIKQMPDPTLMTKAAQLGAKWQRDKIVRLILENLEQTDKPLTEEDVVYDCYLQLMSFSDSKKGKAPYLLNIVEILVAMVLVSCVQEEYQPSILGEFMAHVAMRANDLRRDGPTYEGNHEPDPETKH